MRRNVYPRRVQAGTMKQTDADFQIAVMSAIYDNLKAQRPAEPQKPQQPTQGALEI